MTQKFLLLFLSVMISLSASAQVGINTTTPDPSAALDVTATDKGLLIPRVALASAIASPAAGLMVHQTTAPAGFYYYNGTAWTMIGETGPQGPAGPIGATGEQGPQGPAGTNGSNGQGVPTGGTASQVLTKIDGTNYNTQWVTPSAAGGPSLQLLATKTSGSQTLARANVTNTGDLVTFNNVVTTPTSGSYSTSTNAYTASVAGLYYIQASSRCEDNASATSTTNQYLYVDINGGSLSSVNNVLPVFIGSAPSNMPAGSKGRGYVGTMVYLNTNDVVTIKGLSTSASVDGTALKTDGSTRFMVVKL